MEGEPGLERGGCGSRLRLVLQAGALALIVLLFVVLVQRTLARGAGPHFVSEIKAGKTPAAPHFDLPVIWLRSETWPATLRGALGASWCGPCKSEAPRLVAAAKAHAGQVVFLGVDVHDLKQGALRFLERYGLNYPSVRDGGDATSGPTG